MSRQIDNEEDFYPKSIRESIEQFMCLNWSGNDFDYIISCPKDKKERLYANFCPTVKDICGLEHNYKLRENCGFVDLSSQKASEIIVDAIWEYFQGKELSQF
ncbi:hypothetical protein L6250_02945 [Candidatus Parcubacteria bacterium]|nr:hypothetical protein [Candidatus Parcubacteria bacterium]